MIFNKGTETIIQEQSEKIHLKHILTHHNSKTRTLAPVMNKPAQVRDLQRTCLFLLSLYDLVSKLSLGEKFCFSVLLLLMKYIFLKKVLIVFA